MSQGTMRRFPSIQVSSLCSSRTKLKIQQFNKLTDIIIKNTQTQMPTCLFRRNYSAITVTTNTFTHENGMAVGTSRFHHHDKRGITHHRQDYAKYFSAISMTKKQIISPNSHNIYSNIPSLSPSIISIPNRFNSTTTNSTTTTTTTTSTTKRTFRPQKAAVKLTPDARNYCKALIQHYIQSLQNKKQEENSKTKEVIQEVAIDKNGGEEEEEENENENGDSSVAGIMLKFQQSSTGEPRMVFLLDFVQMKDIGPNDEGVSLEVITNPETNKEEPKSPLDSINDGLPKLYIHHSAFLKILGGTLDIQIGTDGSSILPIIFDREGNELDPNA